MMESEFQMSMMEELTFFLGIQVKQTNQSTFVHQAEYMIRASSQVHEESNEEVQNGGAQASV
jgi:isopentenyldiphosphate isomerase